MEYTDLSFAPIGFSLLTSCERCNLQWGTFSADTNVARELELYVDKQATVQDIRYFLNSVVRKPIIYFDSTELASSARIKICLADMRDAEAIGHFATFRSIPWVVKFLPLKRQSSVSSDDPTKEVIPDSKVFLRMHSLHHPTQLQLEPLAQNLLQLFQKFGCLLALNIARYSADITLLAIEFCDTMITGIFLAEIEKIRFEAASFSLIPRHMYMDMRNYNNNKAIDHNSSLCQIPCSHSEREGSYKPKTIFHSSSELASENRVYDPALPSTCAKTLSHCCPDTGAIRKELETELPASSRLQPLTQNKVFLDHQYSRYTDLRERTTSCELAAFPSTPAQHCSRPSRKTRLGQGLGAHNSVDIDRIRAGLDVRTTSLIKSYTFLSSLIVQSMLKHIIDETSLGRYDFLYLRIDFANNCNVGYAFINFEDPIWIVEFVVARAGRRWNKFNSDKIAEVSYATIQGRDCLIQKFRNSSVMLEHPDFRPKLYLVGIAELAGVEEAFPLPDNPSKMRRSVENAEHVGLFAPRHLPHVSDNSRGTVFQSPRITF